jgi:hypothetical protein
MKFPSLKFTCTDEQISVTLAIGALFSAIQHFPLLFPHCCINFNDQAFSALFWYSSCRIWGSHSDGYEEFYLLFLLLHSYRPLSLFQLQENTSSHLAIGCGIFLLSSMFTIQ